MTAVFVSVAKREDSKALFWDRGGVIVRSLFSKETPFFEGDPAIPADDEVVEKVDAKKLACLYGFLGEA